MFPLADMQLLLEFARGKASWNVDVFDAALRVVSYFGRMFVSSDQPPVAGAADVRISDQEGIQALDAMTQANADDAVEGHPVAGLNPVLVLTVLRFALKLLASRV